MTSKPSPLAHLTRRPLLRRPIRLTIALGCLIAVSPVVAQGEFPADVQRLDAIVAEAWAAQGMQPAEPCTDDVFLRRITLDLVGRIPTVAEWEAFRADPDRAAKIDELLASESFSRSWSEMFTATMNGYGRRFESDREMLRQWIEQSIGDRKPYDKLAYELIAAKGSSAFDGNVNFLLGNPDEPVVKISRLFLGVRLDCARCHDHPFDRWTQDDFVRMNLFFESVDFRELSEGNIRVIDVPREADDDERPRFLTGARPRTGMWRDELALYTTRSKPFARAYANRLWYTLIGRGIVDPVDDFNRDNPASIPELVEFLAETARSQQFDIRSMVRLICNSRVYQMSSKSNENDGRRKAVFASRTVKPLTAEQAFDSLALAMDRQVDSEERREIIQRLIGSSLDEDFSETWQYRETVQQLIARLNLSLDVPGDSTTALYRRILSRDPTDRELALCEGHSSHDIAFALIMSNEFFFNH